MVNLPDHEGVLDEPALTPTGIRNARNIIDRMSQPVASGGSYDRANRLHATNINWGQDGNGMYGKIDLIDDEGTIYKTERFPIPTGIDLHEIRSFSQSDGDIVMRMNNGDSFVVSIQSTQTPPPAFGSSVFTAPLTRGDDLLYYTGDAHGIMIDEGDRWAGNPKKKTIKLPKNMKCTFCNEHIHYPDKLVELLGEKGTKDYLKYCRKSKTKPQLFCCGCYGFIENKPKIYGALNKLNKQLKKFVDINQREKEIKTREKELDKELNKIKKLTY